MDEEQQKKRTMLFNMENYSFFRKRYPGIASKAERGLLLLVHRNKQGRTHTHTHTLLSSLLTYLFCSGNRATGR